jgi:hypothetical protein
MVSTRFISCGFSADGTIISIIPVNAMPLKRILMQTSLLTFRIHSATRQMILKVFHHET